MRATSVPETLSVDIVGAIVGESGGATLRELERRSLVLTAPGDGACHYHPLMRAFLATDAAHFDREDLETAHKRVAAFYDAHVPAQNSLAHWVASGEGLQLWSRAAMGVFSGTAANAAGRAATERRLLDERDAATSPDDALGFAAALVYVGRVDEAERLLAPHRAALAGGDARDVARLSHTDFVIAFAQGDLLRAARLGPEARRQLDAALPGEWDRLRGPIGRITLLSMLGLHHRARRALGEPRTRDLAQSPSDAITLEALRADIDLGEGNLAGAQRAAERAIAAATTLQLVAPAGALYVRGAVLAEHNDERAAGVLRDAIVAADADALPHVRVLARVALAGVLHDRDDVAAARQQLDDARAQLRGPTPELTDRIDDAEAMMALRDGDIERARHTVERLHGLLRTRRRARVLACAGDHEQAAAVLEHAHCRTRREHLDLLLLRARITSNEDRRQELVATALQSTEDDRYARTFHDETDWVRPVLAGLVADWPTSYAVDALAAVLAERPRTAVAVAALLTPREQQVFRYLATPMSLREIARALFVSHNTIKTHVRSIYTKVGARDRHEVAALAAAPSSRVTIV
jgi:LuxR family maltose regulon positive regulatory protein